MSYLRDAAIYAGVLALMYAFDFPTWAYIAPALCLASTAARAAVNQR